ncbi:hypothetical protein RB595_006959 [Gaeumannomyces hyphopodioides]
MEPRRNHQFDPFSPGASQFSHPDPAFDKDEVDWNDPTAISQLIGVQVHSKTPAQAQREAENLAQGTLAHYTTLRAILDRHEATIQKRWAKRTAKARLKVLLDLWPDMPATHRPDFDAFRKGSGAPGPYMWPQVNQEDLCKPRSLPLLLNSRGRHHPSNFAAIDGDAMHIGKVSGKVMPIFLNGYVMILNGIAMDSSGFKYGQLLSWDDHEDAFAWMHTRTQFLPGEGLLILEAQERLLGFLVACCKTLLHDIPPASLTTGPVEPEPRFKTELELNGFDNLAVMAAEGPYRVPADLDLDRMCAMLAARASAAEDEIWALREDPGYFAEHLTDIMEHRQELVKDTGGALHPVVRPAQDDLFWARVIGDAVISSYLGLEMYTELLRQARALKALHTKHAAKISPQEPLPKDFLDALLTLQHYLNQATKGPMGQLKVKVAASPPLRHLFVRLPAENLTKIIIRSKPGVKRTSIERQLIWLLSTIWEDDRQLFLCRLTSVVDELERLIQTQPEADRLVSNHVRGVIGDLSIMSQCLHQLEMYQPWANTFENAMVERKQAIQKEFAERTKTWAVILNSVDDKLRIRANIVTLGRIEPHKFTYPVDKRRSRDNVETMRRAEEYLDAFWEAMDRTMHPRAGNLEGTATKALLSQSRILQRTPVWVEPAAAVGGKKKGGSVAAAAADDLEELYKPLSTLYFGLSSEKDTSLPGTSKTKAKTKGTADTSSMGTDQQEEQAQQAVNPQPTFGVDARALKVFRTLFFTPNASSTPGEVHWTDFLHAMGSTGFLAKKLYGSAWQFQPTRPEMKEAIQFHEPHPHVKIPFREARRHGRRLERKYGWNGGMFVPKS